MPTVETRGARIAYSDTGAGDAVLLIQGVGLPGEGWRPQIDGLADRWRVLAFDNRGIGASQLAGGAVTIEDMAADALAVADAAGAQRIHVVGHSMGGVIAQAVALAAPTRVRSLAFLCTFARGAQAAKLSLGMFVTALRMRLGPRAARRNAFMSIVMTPRALATLDKAGRAREAESLRALFGRDLAEQPAIVMTQLRAMTRYDARADLPKLASIPTLVLTGAEDRIARPAYGRELASLIPGARYEELPDAAHGLTIHRAPDVNRRLDEHFRSAPA
ncbi:MAG TPA: alpha/beta fold hydrolase [Polyangia bacterium]|nr:alpha/beta fold hydrolase [Polyangia bacterium]HVY36571.1 alpha/beta fold hydrolase [Polyangia bacterium]